MESSMSVSPCLSRKDDRRLLFPKEDIGKGFLTFHSGEWKNGKSFLPKKNIFGKDIFKRKNIFDRENPPLSSVLGLLFCMLCNTSSKSILHTQPY